MNILLLGGEWGAHVGMSNRGALECHYIIEKTTIWIILQNKWVPWCSCKVLKMPMYITLTMPKFIETGTSVIRIVMITVSLGGILNPCLCMLRQTIWAEGRIWKIAKQRENRLFRLFCAATFWQLSLVTDCQQWVASVHTKWSVTPMPAPRHGHMHAQTHKHNLQKCLVRMSRRL